MMSKLPARRPIIKWNNLCGFHYELPRGVKFGGAVGCCRRHFFPLAFASFAFLILAAIHAGIGTAFADE